MIDPTHYTRDLVDVYYSRIANFGTPSMAVTTTRFTSAPMHAEGFGDFMSLATGGASSRVLCSAYVVTVPDGTGWKAKKACYLRKIIINYCALSESGNFTSSDANSILDAISEGSASGDILEDGVVDFDDLALLLYWCESTGVSP